MPAYKQAEKTLVFEKRVAQFMGGGDLEFPYNQLLLPWQANWIDIPKPVTAPSKIGTKGLSRVERGQNSQETG